VYVFTKSKVNCSITGMQLITLNTNSKRVSHFHTDTVEHICNLLFIRLE